MDAIGGDNDIFLTVMRVGPAPNVCQDRYIHQSQVSRGFLI